MLKKLRFARRRFKVRSDKKEIITVVFLGVIFLLKDRTELQIINI